LKIKQLQLDTADFDLSFILLMLRLLLR